MKVKDLGKLLIIGVIFASLIAAAGCSSKPQSKPAPKEPSPPGELKQLQTSLDELYNALKPESPGKEQGGQKKQQQSQGKGGEEQTTEKGKQAEETKKKAPTEIDWNKLQAQAEKIHDQWNKLEPRWFRPGLDRKISLEWKKSWILCRQRLLPGSPGARLAETVLRVIYLISLNFIQKGAT